MRILLQESFNNEIPYRLKYIYDTFHLWMIPRTNDNNFIHLESIPSTQLDVLFIIGHNVAVKNLLSSQDFSEKRIVAITCDGLIHVSALRLKGKTLYMPYLDHGYAHLLDGSQFGFNFNLTESEIKLYNSDKSLDLSERLDSCFLTISKQI